MTHTLPLSPDDRASLEHREPVSSGVLLITAILTVVFAVSAFRKDAVLYSFGFGIFTFLFLYPCVWLSKFLFTFSQRRALERDLRTGEKLVIQATVRTYQKGRLSVTTSSGKALSLVVSGLTVLDYDWDEDEHGSVHFEYGGTYRIEYLPASKNILRVTK